MKTHHRGLHCICSQANKKGNEGTISKQTKCHGEGRWRSGYRLWIKMKKNHATSTHKFMQTNVHQAAAWWPGPGRLGPQARPKLSRNRVVGPAWLGLIGPGFGWLTASGWAMHITIAAILAGCPLGSVDETWMKKEWGNKRGSAHQHWLYKPQEIPKNNPDIMSCHHGHPCHTSDLWKNPKRSEVSKFWKFWKSHVAVWGLRGKETSCMNVFLFDSFGDSWWYMRARSGRIGYTKLCWTGARRRKGRWRRKGTFVRSARRCSGYGMKPGTAGAPQLPIHSSFDKFTISL